MSMHKHSCNTPELRKALAFHGLKVDTPSQLADTFRLGWLAREVERSDTCKPRPMSEAPRDGTVILVFPRDAEHAHTAYWGQAGGWGSKAWRSAWGCTPIAGNSASLLGWLPCPTYTGEAVE